MSGDLGEFHRRSNKTGAPGQKPLNLKPWRHLGKLSKITLALHQLAVGGCGSTAHGNAGIAGECGHGRAADEGIQAVFVSGQDPNCF